MKSHHPQRDRENVAELARPPGRSNDPAQAGGEADALLDLQESAGNRAVGELLGGGGPPALRADFAPRYGVVQRQEDDPTDEVTGGASDQVTGVSADEVTGGASGGASDQVTGVSADEVTGGASDQVTGVSADEVTGGASDQVTGVSADEVSGGASGGASDEVSGVSADEVTTEAVDAAADLRGGSTDSGPADAGSAAGSLAIPKLDLALPLLSAQLGTGSGRGSVELTATMAGDKADPQLFVAVATGQSLGTVVLEFVSTKFVIVDAFATSMNLSAGAKTATVRLVGSVPAK